MIRDYNPDDATICVGQWRFQVAGNKAYVHHAEHPGDIHVTAETSHFNVEVLTDDVEDEVNSLAVDYADLGPKIVDNPKGV